VDDALTDCVWVVGSSARVRNLGPEVLAPRAAAARLVAHAQTAPVALVFGCERSGLANADLDRCHAIVQIPTSSEYSSLNLGMAVQLLCYELRMEWLAQRFEPTRNTIDPPAQADDLQRFFAHLEQVLFAAEFLDTRRPRLMRRLRRLFSRAAPDARELRILRGMLTALDPDGEPARRRHQASQ
jgi:TrmH family RNA methyltransferase